MNSKLSEKSLHRLWDKGLRLIDENIQRQWEHEKALYQNENSDLTSLCSTAQIQCLYVISGYLHLLQYGPHFSYFIM